jgi:shikimate kinase
VDDDLQITDAPYPAPPPFILDRTIVLVGLMGAGKSSIGKRLAQRLHVPFIDADTEIEAAAGCTIDEIFERHGEAAFRDGERRVIARLLADHSPHILATGGGAFMDPETRAAIKAAATSIWLRADIDVLLKRVKKRNNRPLLKRGDPREILERLINLRYPVYAQADLTVESLDGPHEQVVEAVIEKIASLRRGAPGTPS